MADQTATTVLRYQLDKRAQAEAVKGGTELKKNLQESTKSTRDLNAAMDAMARQRVISEAAVDAGKFAAQIGDTEVAANRLKRGLSEIKPELTGNEYANAALLMERTATEAGRWSEEVKEVAQTMAVIEDTSKAVADNTQRAAKAGSAQSLRSQVGAIGDVDTSLATFRGAADFAGIGGGGLKAASELFAVVEAVGQLRQAASEAPQAISALVRGLGPVGIGLTAAVAAAAIGIKLAVEEINRAAAGYEGISKIQQRVFREFSELTTEEARERLQEAEARAQATQALIVQREELKRMADSAQNADVFASVGTVIADVFTAIPTEVLAGEIRDLNKDLQDSQTEIQQYAQAIEQGRFATNDAVEVERQLADERRRATQIYLADFSARIDEETKYADLLTTGSSEAVQAMIEADERRLAVIDSMLPELYRLNDGSEEYADAIDSLLKEQDLLVASTQRLSEVTATLAAQEQQAAFADSVTATISDLTGAFGSFITAGGEFVGALTDYTGKIEVDTSKLGDIAKKLSDTIAEADRAAAQARTDAIKTAADAQTKALETQNEALLKLDEDFARKRQEINRKANATIANAIGRRDALAFLMAEQTRKEEQRKLKDDTARQRQTIADNYQKQLKTIDENLRKQTDTIDRRYKEQTDRARKAAQDAAAIEQQRINEAIAKAQQEQRDRLLAQTQGIAQRVQAETQGAQQVVAVATDMFSRILQYGRNAASGLPTGSSAGSPIPGSPTSPGAPARPIPIAPGGGLTKDSGLTINVNGAQMSSITAATEQQVYDEIGKLFRAATPGRR